MGLGVNFAGDPLTCDWWALWRDVDNVKWGCNCAAKDCPEMCHSETCAVTPIYADLMSDGELTVRQLLSEIAFQMITIQTVIKCAICHKDMMAKDACLIWDLTYPRQDVLPDRAVCVRCFSGP